MYCYAFLAEHHPGWSLKDVKALTRRERGWWIEMAKWRHSKGA